MNDMILQQLSPKKSVEDLLKKETQELNWTFVDVLYSFKGIYTLGIKAFYPNEALTAPNGTVLYQPDDEGNRTKQRIYSGAYLENHFKDYPKLNDLRELKEFIEVYETIGNLIPVWPGANSHRGVFGVYDLADLYFYHENIEEFGKSFYKEFFPKFSVYSIPRFKKKNLPDSYQIHDYLTMSQYEYKRFLKHIVQVINHRNKQFS